MNPESGQPFLKPEIPRITQQSIERRIGPEADRSLCLPTAMYVLAKAYGYEVGEDPKAFVESLNKEQDFTFPTGWKRPDVSADLRQQYSIETVSWRTCQNARPGAGTQDITPMVERGYLHSQREIDFYKEHVVDRSLEQIVESGHPVVVTVSAGFAQNKASHSVILASWEGDLVNVIDPDERNEQKTYPAEHVLAALSPEGACSVMLRPATTQ